MSDIRVTFVLPEDANNEKDASETMIQAYESCKQLVDNISWVKESKLSTKEFNKLDYIVFENFEGKDFEKLIKSKCARIVGPLAVSVCLMEGKPIPSFQWPIFNVAMYGYQVTCSQITKADKELIKNRVQLMGGLYTGNFTSSITHLICDGTKSEKYMLAAERGVKLMLPSWINYIFEESQLNNINANDPNILKKYSCPPFHKLTICTTGITNSKEKVKLSELISSNGGRMVAKLNLTETDVLICHGSGGSTSEKYKAARKTHLPCVIINWIYDSIEKGYALPHEHYYVKTVTSTPTKEGENIDPNFSTISCIGTTSIQKSTINETVNISQMSTTVPGFISSNRKREASEDLVDKIEIKKVKNAGHFLDGCSIFVTGFNPEQRDKLNKIVNLSGATRYDDFSERVTHIIVGDPSCSEVTTIKSMGVPCILVSVQWLLDSVDQQKPAKEDRYLINKTNVIDDVEKEKIGSPLSKKALSLLKTAIVRSDNKETNVNPERGSNHEDVLTRQYLKNNTTEKEEDTLAMLLKNQDGTSIEKNSPVEEFNLRTRSFKSKSTAVSDENNQTLEFKPHETSTQVSQVTSNISENDTDVIPIFQYNKFFIYGFNEEDSEAYKEYIVGVGGVVLDSNFEGEADYVVVPPFDPPEDLPPSQELINDLWIIQSIEEERVCDIQYYHRPMKLPSSLPLKDCVVTISVYTGQERHFLKSVIEGLGGIFQEQFSRKNIANKNVLASTHLVSSQASGKKYEAALKWNLPVVNKDWLLECAKTGIKVDENGYIILANTTITDDACSNAIDQELVRNHINDGSEKQQITGKHKLSSENVGLSSPVEIKTDHTTQSPIKQSYNLNQKDTPETCSHVTPINKILQDGINDKVFPSPPSPKAYIPWNPKTPDTPVAKTPIKQSYNLNQKDTPETCSQVTPINKILQDAINDKVLPTPPSPKTYFPWNPKTPDTPIGAFIRPNPSPRLRKEMQKYINSFPDFVPPKRRVSTPLTELKKRLRDKVMGGGEFSQRSETIDGPSTDESYQENNAKKIRRESLSQPFEDHLQSKSSEGDPSMESVVVQQKLQELQQIVKANGTSSATRRSSRIFEPSSNPPGIVLTNAEIQSQVCTVGWDYGEAETQTEPQKLFLLSGVDALQREQLTSELKTLGAMVTESNTYDESCTHLICPKPARNEKTLACMAAGKWILHLSYVGKCVTAGRFLNEEEFEFGNPKARHSIPYEEKDNSIYFWRKEIKRRGYGAFNDMRAILVAEKKEPIANVIQAGGGVVIHVTPPFDDTIHATHCLLEVKMVKDFSEYVPLAQQGIKCINTIYINDYLWRNKKDESDYIVPFFTKYYQ